MKLSLVLIVLACCLYGCIVEPFGPEFPAGTVEGYRPLYGTITQTEISLEDPRPVKKPGKIYLYNNFLLVNEIKEGIHVFDNNNPAEPLPVSFINLLGNTDMAIKDDILYADHNGDLKSIRLNSFTSIAVLDSLPLSDWNLGMPPPAGFYFECVEQSKGVVVGWQVVELTNPSCYATN
jgi:hypothetical protein